MLLDRKDYYFLLLAILSVVIVYRSALFNFFTQDDFILINHFSQNSTFDNLKNVFGYPTVTHFRPLHNLYFLIGGNLFGKSFTGYHLFTLLLHASTCLLIYRSVSKLVGRKSAGAISGLVYGVHPVHFVSLFWISGGATIIGFFFLIWSFDHFLSNKKVSSILLYALSLLASEAMIVGVIFFWGWRFLMQRKKTLDKFLVMVSSLASVFFVIKLFFLTPRNESSVYEPEFSEKAFFALKYYLLRISGFAEGAGINLTSLILLAWLSAVLFLIVPIIYKRKHLPALKFAFLAWMLGLFPFILIPNHLSAHYMNVSVFGFSIIVALALVTLKRWHQFLFVSIFVFISFLNVSFIHTNNWVIKRSNLARSYIKKVERENKGAGSLLVFDDNNLSTSREAYIVLGTGEAIEFWFGDKHYEYCFSAFEKCPDLP